MLTPKGRTLALAIDQGVTELKQQFKATRIEVAAIRTDVAAILADNATNQINECREKIIQWLSIVDPSSNHLAACKKHQPTTGEWLIKRTDLEEWKRKRNSLLWLYGIR